MNIVLNGTVTMYCNIITDIRIAKETGYQGLEIIGAKLYRYLDEGLSIKNLLLHLGDLPVVAMGFIQDIERQKPEEYKALLAETEKMCSLAEQLGCPTVQLLTGPLYVNGPYKGYPDLSWPELRRLTGKNLSAIAEIGKSHNVKFYLEPLNWAPLNKLEQMLELIDIVGKDNVGMVIDFWHFWCSGATPDDISKIDKTFIVGVHVCDALDDHGVPSLDHTQPGRQVWTGGGRIPLKEWVDAVLSTDFDGWLAPELFSSKHWELDPQRTAANLKALLEYIID